MNSVERFRAFSAREPMDRPLRYARFTPDLLRRVSDDAGTDDLATHFDMDRAEDVLPKPPPGYVEPDFSHYYPEFPPDLKPNSIGVLRRPGTFYHFTEIISPLRNATRLSELEEFPVEDFSDWDVSQMAEEVDELHRQGRIATTQVGHMYESAWQIRGNQEFLMDMIDRPEWCELLLEKFAVRNINLARAGVRAGVDLIKCGDDVASQNALMFRKDSWQSMMKSRWARVCAAVRELKPDIPIWYHSDGNIETIIDELREIGVTILNPLQPECLDVGRIAREYKGKLLFDGAMGTQSVLPFGSVDEVRACVKERAAQFGQDLILSPTHTLEPEVPLENIKAFFETAGEIRFQD